MSVVGRHFCARNHYQLMYMGELELKSDSSQVTEQQVVIRAGFIRIPVFVDSWLVGIGPLYRCLQTLSMAIVWWPSEPIRLRRVTFLGLTSAAIREPYWTTGDRRIRHDRSSALQNNNRRDFTTAGFGQRLSITSVPASTSTTTPAYLPVQSIAQPQLHKLVVYM